VTSPRTLRVAAVQVESLNDDPDDNLRRAEPWVARAAADGAQLVVCPEFLAAGYVYSESIWDAGELRGGLTESWLRRLASEHRIYLGASYLEADGAEFYNTFALAGPEGEIVGRVRKESLPAFEGWYFKSSTDPKYIETELGRTSVGICQDNHTARFFARVRRDEPDLLLMPHSAPCAPFLDAVMRKNLAEIGPFYARSFGIPVVMVNKAQGRCLTPVPGVPLLRLRFDFPGLSSISDADGRVLDRLPDQEGVVVADVLLDPSRKRRPPAPQSGYWSRPPHVFPRLFGAFFTVMERLGKRAYAKSRRRPKAARARSAEAGTPARTTPRVASAPHPRTQ
jgi:N-carbamoylputrescine amidase